MGKGWQSPLLWTGLQSPLRSSPVRSLRSVLEGELWTAIHCLGHTGIASVFRFLKWLNSGDVQI